MLLPALATAHSHAFQRALRGRAQRPSAFLTSASTSATSASTSGRTPPREDFWTWRGEMYTLASSLTPESIHDISRVAFAELARAGVRTVGEFHYVHHQPGGAPYDDRTVMADAVIRAAKDAKVRIALLRVAYNRGGDGRPPEEEQRRFCDPSVDDVLRDVDALRAKYAADPDVVVGLAAHSVRAVPPDWLGPLRDYAAKYAIPLHMHVSEQEREVQECVSETGRRPVELLADNGVLSDRFVAVHATHLRPHEARLLGTARAFVCVCPTTERDLGDGLADLTALRQAGVRLCTGVDSHVLVDPLEDLRALETHERLRTHARVTFGGGPSPEAGETPAESLWRSGSTEGEAACGFKDSGGMIAISPDHPELALVAPELLLDAVVFGCTRAVLSPPPGETRPSIPGLPGASRPGDSAPLPCPLRSG
ncbi:MAG TPA: formimidoylglutamate deiminase [Polyangiaceae bacterium]|jgi:formiminoglutamate deiminase|nr:formimidoylglutamate deiminase [Polyangiaceae bacterium]